MKNSYEAAIYFQNTPSSLNHKGISDNMFTLSTLVFAESLGLKFYLFRSKCESPVILITLEKPDALVSLAIRFQSDD